MQGIIVEKFRQALHRRKEILPFTMHKSWNEFKIYLKALIDAEPISNYEVISRAGLSRDAYYKLFAPEREDSSMRKGTVYGLAEALDYSVNYVNSIPQFVQKLARSKNITANYVQSSIQSAVRITGSLETFSRLSNINIFQLKDLMKLSPETVIGISSLDQVNKAIGKLDQDMTSQVSKITSEGHLSDITDHGLLQLINPDNIRKYNISDTERIELTMIAYNRNSQTTLEHWVSVLFTLRALEK